MTDILTPLKHHLVTHILDTSAAISNGRTTTDLLLHLITEFGKLTQEVIIAGEQSSKTPNENGILSKSIDLILCAVDLAFVTNGKDVAHTQALFNTTVDPLDPVEAPILLLGMVGLIDEAGMADTPEHDHLPYSYPENDLVDLCLTLVDQHAPNFNAETAISVMETKLAKWRQTTA